MIIEVWTKEKYAKNEEAGFAARMARAGLPIKAARLSRLYKVEAPWTRTEFNRLGAELLTDNITEHYSISKRPGIKGCYRVEIWLKNSATDVVGESVKEAVHDMLGRSPAGVRFGRAYYARCASGEKLRAVISKTLMNEVVNVCSVNKL